MTKQSVNPIWPRSPHIRTFSYLQQSLKSTISFWEREVNLSERTMTRPSWLVARLVLWLQQSQCVHVWRGRQSHAVTWTELVVEFSAGSDSVVNFHNIFPALHQVSLSLSPSTFSKVSQWKQRFRSQNLEIKRVTRHETLLRSSESLAEVRSNC